MQFHLERDAFVLATDLPFNFHIPRWKVKTGITLNILLWVQMTPEKECWLNLLTTGEAVSFQGIKVGTQDKIITRKVRARRINSGVLGHGEIWEVSFLR